MKLFRNTTPLSSNGKLKNIYLACFFDCSGESPCMWWAKKHMTHECFHANCHDVPTHSKYGMTKLCDATTILDCEYRDMTNKDCHAA